MIAKALDALQQERSLLLKGKSADEAEAAVARREKELNEALEKARKQVEGVQNLSLIHILRFAVFLNLV